METLKFKAIINGSQEYLQANLLVEDFEITEQDVLEVIEQGESFEDAINYIKEEYCASWKQRWCKVLLLTSKEFQTLQSKS